MAAATKTRVSDGLMKTLKTTSWTTTLLQGFLFGQRNSKGILVVGIAKIDDAADGKFNQTYVEKHLAGGLEICGIVIFSEDGQLTGETLGNVQKKLVSSQIDVLDGSMLVCVASDTVTDQSFFWLLNYSEPESQRADIVVGDFVILSESVLANIKTNFKLTVSASNENHFNLGNEVEKLCLDVTTGGSYAFLIDNTSILLTDGDVIGLKKDATVSSLSEFVNGSKNIPKSGSLSISVLQRLSCNNNISTCAPFIHHNIDEGKCFMVDLPVDVICLIPDDLPVKDIYKHLTKSIGQQLETMSANLDAHKKAETYFLPEVFHFQPLGTGYFLSVVYPRDVTDISLESIRRQLHTVFGLPVDKPVFKRCNKHIFGGENIPGGYILNPHTAINASPLKDSKFYLIQGNYTYHHYMQDDFDDNKWGCAYRSLQTLVSWFKFQGYTDKHVPSHKEIQQTLVDIGDKDTKFVGSRKWIGSLEVSYCLENLIGITSKIMSVSAGAELGAKGRELAQHFLTQGSPIMIGGGVLAHTILGINFSEVTGDIRFLILDPHYTGGENIREIIDKGWCGWKGPDFWDQTAMYNLCMPQRPHVI